MPIPEAARSQAWDYGCSLAGIADLNPSKGMDVRHLWVLCVVLGWSLVQSRPTEYGVSVCDREDILAL
jgi:hypothetical protein